MAFRHRAALRTTQATYAEKERGLGDRYVIAMVVTTESRDTAHQVLYSLGRSGDVVLLLLLLLQISHTPPQHRQSAAKDKTIYP